MDRKIRIKDGISKKDSAYVPGFRGEIIFGKGLHHKQYVDPYGKKTYISEFEEELYRDENIVPIGGYQFAFSKLFNIELDKETTLRVGDLNDEAPQMRIGVQRQEYSSIHYNAETHVPVGSTSNVLSLPPLMGVNISSLNFIFGFLIGDGGAREDSMTAIAPNYKRRTLFRAIPFRMSNDGTVLQEGKYFGKIETFTGVGTMEPVTSYYVKKFDSPAPRIVHAWATDNPNEMEIVDDSVFASTSTIPIESYVEINLSVSHEDGRGFFTSTDSSPRINEFGLVSGWFNPELNDYESIRLFTHFTRPSIALSDGDSIQAIYRIYAR